MPVVLSDEEIAALIAERKPCLRDQRERIRLRPKHGHKEAELEVQGVEGNRFRVIIRQSHSNALDFSIILAFCPPNTNQLFRLQRYNGKSHEHTNQIEGTRFYGFHMHTATIRYQELGAKEDTYAEASDRYSDIHGAFSCMCQDCGIDFGDDGRGLLFPVPQGPQLEDA